MASPITDFIKHHYRHFNAAALVAAAEDYVKHLQGGNKMLLTMAGAMSTAEIGLSLAEMIRQDKVHAIVCTGANLAFLLLFGRAAWGLANDAPPAKTIGWREVAWGALTVVLLAINPSRMA